MSVDYKRFIYGDKVRGNTCIIGTKGPFIATQLNSTSS